MSYYLCRLYEVCALELCNESAVSISAVTFPWKDSSLNSADSLTDSCVVQKYRNMCTMNMFVLINTESDGVVEFNCKKRYNASL